MRARHLLLDLAPLLLVPTLFVAVLLADSSSVHLRTTVPREAFSPTHCTWSCHNHGCRHAPVLPSLLTGDQGLFGQTIHALYALGYVLVPSSRGAGYGAANLLVLCAAWPGTMYALYLVALRQRRKLRVRREGGAT